MIGKFYTQLIEPIHYVLHFNIEKSNIFSGETTISLKINEKCNLIKLFATPKLQFGKSCSVLQDKKSISFEIVREKSMDRKKKEILTDVIQLTSKDSLEPGKGDLKISFKGEVETKEIYGIYTVNGSYLTHFEPYFARNAFPSFDLFHYKTTFDLSVTIWTSFKTYISNMPIKSISEKKETTVIFERTPKMSTYLLGFCIGDYILEKEEIFESENDFPVRVYVPNSTITYASSLIMEIVLKTLKILEKDFEFPITQTNLTKLDIVIVPKLYFGGMENHGCIFISEKFAILNKKMDDSFTELIVHEIVHHCKYFFIHFKGIGNLVSCSMWIKEGLAQYYEKTVTDILLNRKSFQFSTKKEDQELPKIEKGENDCSKDYSGVFYTKCMNWIGNQYQKHGKEKFQKLIRHMIQEYQFSYIPEEYFIELFNY